MLYSFYAYYLSLLTFIYVSSNFTVGSYQCMPIVAQVWYTMCYLDQIRALMDKPTNIRNMSVIAHGML